MEDKNVWCVYMHTSPSGKVYIGITSQKPERRWKNGCGYLRKRKNGDYAQPAMARAINKYGWENFQHDILFENLSKQDAEHKESLLVAFWETNNPKFGYNIRNGGGSHGSMSEEAKKKISESLKGRTIPKEAIEKSRESRKGKYTGKNNWNYGKHPSEKTRDKLRQAKLGKSTGRGRVVYCVELNKQWDSVYQAQKETNIRHIGEVLNSKRTSAGRHPETGEKLHWIELFNAEEIK